MQPIGRSPVLAGIREERDGNRAVRRDVVWGETADMSVWGKVAYTTARDTDRDADKKKDVKTDGDVNRGRDVHGNLGQEPLNLEKKETARAKARGMEEQEGEAAVKGHSGCLWMYRGAAITVSVYVHTQYVLPDHRGQVLNATSATAASMSASISTSTVLMRSDAGGLNMLHAGDQLVGRTVVDLSTLALGMVSVCGWYHLINAKHEESGQVFLSVSLPTPRNCADESVEGGDVDAVNEAVSEEVEEEVEQEDEVEDEEVHHEMVESIGMDDRDEDGGECNREEHWESGGDDFDMSLSVDDLNPLKGYEIMGESVIGTVDPLDGDETSEYLDDYEDDVEEEEEDDDDDSKDELLECFNEDENKIEDESEDEDVDNDEVDRKSHGWTARENAEDSCVGKEKEEKEEGYDREECDGTDWDNVSREKDGAISLSSHGTNSSFHETIREEEGREEKSGIADNETLTESHDGHGRDDVVHTITDGCQTSPSPCMHVMAGADNLEGRDSQSVNDDDTNAYCYNEVIQQVDDDDGNGDGDGDGGKDGYVDDDEHSLRTDEIRSNHQNKSSDYTRDSALRQCEGQISRESVKEREREREREGKRERSRDREGERERDVIATRAVGDAEDEANITENDKEYDDEEVKEIERKIERERVEGKEKEKRKEGADEISVVSTNVPCDSPLRETRESPLASPASISSTSIPHTSHPHSPSLSHSSFFAFSASPADLSVVLDGVVAKATGDSLSLSRCEAPSDYDAAPRDIHSSFNETVPCNLDNDQISTYSSSNNSSSSSTCSKSASSSSSSKRDSSTLDNCSHSSAPTEHEHESENENKNENEEGNEQGVYNRKDCTQHDIPDKCDRLQVDQVSQRTDEMGGQEGSSASAAYSSDSDFEKPTESCDMDVGVVGDGDMEAGIKKAVEEVKVGGRVEGEGNGRREGQEEVFDQSTSNEEDKERVGDSINVRVTQMDSKGHNTPMQYESTQMHDSDSGGVATEGRDASCTLIYSTLCTQDASIGSGSGSESESRSSFGSNQERPLKSAGSKVPLDHLDEALATIATGSNSSSRGSYRDEISESARMRCLVQAEVERVMTEQTALRSLLSLAPSPSTHHTTTCSAPPAVQASYSRPLTTTGPPKSQLKFTVEADVAANTDRDRDRDRDRVREIDSGRLSRTTSQLCAVSRPLGDVIASALSKVRRAKKKEESSQGRNTSDRDRDRERDRVRFPGRQRQFLDLETERVAQIMLRTMARKDDAL